MNTLRGVFPEPPPVSKRNFIKENVIQIKRMQGIGENSSQRNFQKKHSQQIVENAKTMKLIQTTRKQLQNLTRLSNTIERGGDKHTQLKETYSDKMLRRQPLDTPPFRTAVEAYDRRHFREIGIQTESNLRRINENATIKYPSQHVCALLGRKTPKSPRKQCDADDVRKSPVVRTSSEIHLEKKEPVKDFVRENAQVTRFSNPKFMIAAKDPTVPPPTYQKGVVPKYLRDRKDFIRQNQVTEGDERCPDGHVILPENERKETLRMLRQSYAELVTELNLLPVRSDTLKVRNRKIELENQLKKLDEGIKVFTRPKVYVKIGA